MTTASNEPVLLRRDEGRVAILTLNRPHAMNALSGELIDALQAEFDRLAKDKEIRCVVIEANGPRLLDRPRPARGDVDQRLRLPPRPADALLGHDDVDPAACRSR